MRSLLITIVIAITACGPMNRNNTGSSSGSDTAQTEMVCHDVRDTGSLMAHRECQPRNHVPSDDDRKDTETLIQKPRSQPTSAH